MQELCKSCLTARELGTMLIVSPMLEAAEALRSVGSRGTQISGQPRHSDQWAAEALTSVGSRGTHITGQPRHLHQWAAEAHSHYVRDVSTSAIIAFILSSSPSPTRQEIQCSHIVEILWGFPNSPWVCPNAPWVSIGGRPEAVRDQRKAHFGRPKFKI